MRLVSLFAGAGGEVLGGRAAGLQHVEAVEWDRDAATTLEFATGGNLFAQAHPAWGSEPPLVVRRCSVEHWTPVQADIWWASPPCQPDSDAGNRLGADDPRDGWPLVWSAFDRAEVKPTWIACETVRGIIAKSRIERWEGILEQARQRFEWVGWQLLDCADYGIPQHRKRVILICGPRPVRFPKPTHSRATLDADKASGAYWSDGPRQPGEDGLLAPRTMRETLGLWGTIDGGRNSDANPTQERVRDTDEPAPTMGTRGNMMFEIGGTRGGKGVRTIGPDQPSGTVTTAGDIRRFQDLTDRPSTTIAAQMAGNAGPFVVRTRSDRDYRDGSDEPSPTVRANGLRGDVQVELGAQGSLPQSQRVADPDKPAPTVTCPSATGGRRSMLIPDLLDVPSPTVVANKVKGSTISDRSDGRPRENRASCRLHRAYGRHRLTVKECALLQGFPPDWPFHGSGEEKYRQVGNAVPPKLAEVVFRAIIEASS